jgi:6-phosphogluconolactonase
MRIRNLLALTLLSLALLLPAFAEDALVYIGTYTARAGGASKDPVSKGIYVAKMNLDTGEISAPELAAETQNPSFLVIHQNGKFLYAVGELGGSGGTVTAYTIDRASGKLTKLNHQPAHGTSTCHVIVDKTGKYVLLANYGNGSVASYPINADGSLGEAISILQHKGSSVNPQRQRGPHAHSINLDATNKFAVAADLGTDKLYVYAFDAKTGKLSEHSDISMKPGAGPRHFNFHPSNKYAYAINEMHSTVTAMSFDPIAGRLTEIQTIPTIPIAPEPNMSTAEILVHPSGNFVYGSNRGHDSIAVFSIDKKTGKLARVENEPTQGKTPRNFGISPDGKWLVAANQNTDSMVVFKIDPKTGTLTPNGQKIDAPMPVCVRFLRLGKK